MFRILGVIGFIALSSSVSAKTIYCVGKVENSFIEANGNVHVAGTWHGSWQRICNTNDQDAVRCSLWTSYIVTAIQNNLDVTIQYQGVSNETSCSSLPTYASAPQPNYIMVHNAQR
ncbi:hypothetical protein EYS14_11630 [Alteromonadaceae bacterium M269]|nr:hypothetical protein EYS14_11630 [Alteromonadaceae bacterium M269]